MTSQTILFIILAAIFSFMVVLLMYGYKSKLSKKLKWLLGLFRFLTLFFVLLLIINPKFTHKTYTISKPTLAVLVDNSASVKELGQTKTVTQWVSWLQNNQELATKFEVSFFQFGNEFNELDTLTFSEKNSRISKALTSVSEIFTGQVAPTILLSDGNQTLGTDYPFIATTLKNPVFPLVIGDTTRFSDLKVEQLNTNRYSFLKNKFPVEAILSYSGKLPANTQFLLKQGNKTVYKQNLRFTENDNIKTLSIHVPAAQVGLQKYTAVLLPLDNEKNTTNNYRRFAVEVIDQTTNVLVVSDVLHPDIGTLKKAIETNKQRTVSIKKPTEAVSLLNEYQLVILYQPTGKFSPVFAQLEKLKKNYWLITGKQTQWNFLNTAQKQYLKEVTHQTEEVTAQLNPNYTAFAIEDIGFSDFPPLETRFGELEILTPNDVILQQLIDGFQTNSALLATTELNGVRTAILDGEGIWKWRPQTYLQGENFQSFDEFIGKMVQYLASNKRRSRLEVNHKTFYYSNKAVLISAQYFDKNYVFDNRATLYITLANKETKKKTVFPMLLKNNFYQVDVSSLDAGEYSFTVTVKEEAVSRSGAFTILEYNVEQQFLSPDVTKLQQLATHTNGKVYFQNQSQELIANLIADERFKQIEKAEEKTVPLISWKYLLALIAFTLAIEWFSRKYNGLI